MYVSPKTDQSLVITESSCKIAHKCKKVTTLNCNVQLFCTTGGRKGPNQKGPAKRDRPKGTGHKGPSQKGPKI